MKRFESGDLYQPAAQSQGFSPLQVPDITPLLRENQQARMQESQNIANAQLADLKMEEQALKYQALLEDETVGNLAKFSETLSNAVVKYAEKRNEREMERGLMLAYTNGVDPEASAEYDVQEAALEKGAAQINKAAGQFYQEGMPVDMVKQVQNLSGWAKYGYMKGLAEQAGANYGSFYMQAAEEMKVMVPGREEPISLLEATTAPERAAVKTAIAQQYISQFRGMNPMLLNKYLFPKMKEWEQGDDLEFAADQRKHFKANQQEEFKNQLFNGVTGTNSSAEFEKLLKINEHLFGGMAATKQFAFDQLKKFASAKKLTPDMVDELKRGQIINRATGKPEFVGVLFERQFAEANLEGLYNKAVSADRRTADAAKEAQLKTQWEQIREEARAASPDGKHSEALQEEMRLRLTNELGYEPDWFKKDASRYDDKVDEQRKRWERQLNNGIPITHSNLASMHEENRAYFRQHYGKQIIDPNDALEPGGQTIKEMKDVIEKAANQHFNTEAINAQDPNYVLFQKYALKDFETQYYQHIKTKPPAEALKLARDSVLVKAQAGTYKNKPAETDNERQDNADFAAAHAALQRGDNPKSQKIPGLDRALIKLDQWIADPGKGSIPAIFHSIARTRDNTSGWDIAKAQYELYRGKPLERDLDTRQEAIDKLAPEARQLMIKYPTPGRNARAYVLNSGGSFNDPAYLTSNLAKTQPQSHTVSKFRRAIFAKESTNDYSAVGQPVGGDRAYGGFQVMGANIGPWTQKYVGRRLTPEEFLADPAAQEAVVNGEFNRMLTRELRRGATMQVAVRRAAAEWYGGPNGLANWNNPDFKGAFPDHPNMAEYTWHVWQLFQGND